MAAVISSGHTAKSFHKHLISNAADTPVLKKTQNRQLAIGSRRSQDIGSPVVAKAWSKPINVSFINEKKPPVL